MDLSILTKKELIERLYELENRQEKNIDIDAGILANSLIGLFKMNLEGEFYFLNEAMAKSLGYNKKKELRPRKLHKIFKDRNVIGHLIKTVTSKGSVDNLETELITGSGHVKTMLLTARLSNGEVTGMMIDITKRKNVELAYEESEQRYRSLFESANDAIIISDPDTGYILDANRKAEELLEMPAIEIIGKHQCELHPPEYREKYIGGFQKSSERPGASVELFLESKNGNRIPVEVCSSIINIQGRRLMQGIFRDLTERKKAEEALNRSEERYRDLIENINEVVFSVDNDGVIDYISPVISSITGLQPVDIIGRNFIEFIHEDDIEPILKAFQLTLENKQQVEEYRIITGENDFIWVRISANPIVVKNEVVGVLGIISDISSVKEAEEKKRTLEMKYQNLIDNIPDLIVELDKEGRFTFLSSRVRSMFGYTPEELIGTVPVDIVHPDDLENIMGSMAEAFNQKRYRNIEYRIRHKDGHYLSLSSSGRVLEENGNETLVGVVRDETDKKKAEQALRESEEKFRLIFQNASEGIIYIDKNGTIDDANPKLLEITDLEREEVVGKSFVDLVDLLKVPDTDLEDQFKSLISGNKHERSEWSIINKMGEKRILYAYPSLILKGGEVVGLNVVIEDVTEQRQFESRIIQERKRAELYLDILSHDIKNLDQVIISSSELLLSRPDFPDEYRKYLQDSKTQAEAISELISIVKKLSEVDVNNFNRGSIDVTPMLSNSIDLVTQLYPARNIKINNELKMSQILVEGNELLQDVFNNILTNAVKYNRNANVEIDINCTLESDSGFYRLEFRDNGPGVPDELKQRIFNRFERGDDSVSGTGLGLTIAHEVVSRFGGGVWVEDCIKGDHSKGSKFVIRLPVPGEH